MKLLEHQRHIFNYELCVQDPTALVLSPWFRVQKKALENLIESKKNNKKAIHSQGLMKNVSALGVQNVTSQLLIKPMQK